jgi:hypothetical protein
MRLGEDQTAIVSLILIIGRELHLTLELASKLESTESTDAAARVYVTHDSTRN